MRIRFQVSGFQIAQYYLWTSNFFFHLLPSALFIRFSLYCIAQETLPSLRFPYGLSNCRTHVCFCSSKKCVKLPKSPLRPCVYGKSIVSCIQYIYIYTKASRAYRAEQRSSWTCLSNLTYIGPSIYLAKVIFTLQKSRHEILFMIFIHPFLCNFSYIWVHTFISSYCTGSICLSSLSLFFLYLSQLLSVFLLSLTLFPIAFLF